MLEEVKGRLSDCGSAILLDSLGDARIGICSRFGREPLALYDYDKIITIFMERDGMDYEGALEFFGLNVGGLWAGDGTPVFAYL